MKTERGRFTYLFTDIDGSTERWERAPLQMRAALARHDRLIDAIVAKCGGVVRDHAGDGVFAAFEGEGALGCALEIQFALQREDWSAVGGLPVRVGIHASPARSDALDEQVAINRAARVVASAWGGQIVVSADGAQLSALPSGARLDDLGYCRLRGVNEPLQLFGLSHVGLARRKFPPLRTSSMQEWAAPESPTPFFGRDRECAEIIKLLNAPETRWVTIVGQGGNGKTRLATRIATYMARRSGVWYVPLDNAPEGSNLTAAIARAIRLPLQSGGKQDDQLLEYLRDRQGLLVLDNAENAIDSGELVREITRASPDLRVLATSRFQFRAPEETPYRLGGLDVPTRETVQSAAAYRLFTHEARRVRPDFAPNEKDIDAFIQLCATLAGSPLALRLAAQWCNMFSIGEIVHRVEAGLDFLATSQPGDERHKSLRSVFNGSWALLSPAEKRGLSHLATFVGGFDARAAERVSDVTPELVSVLESKGLLEQTRRARFQLHPLIREYALEKLVRHGDDREMAGRHAAYYLDLAVSEFESAASAGQSAVLDRIESESANLLRAWQHAALSPARHRIWRAGEPLFYAFVLRARYRDAETFFRVKTDDLALNLYFESMLANCLTQRGDLDGAALLAKKVIEDEGSRQVARSHARQALGIVAHARNRFDEAIAHYKAALDIRRARRDLIGCHYSTISLAILNIVRRDHAEARNWIKLSSRYCEQSGNATGRMQLHFHAGELAAQEGRPDAAKANFVQSLRIEEEVRHPQGRARVLISLGRFSAELGERQQALRYLEEAHFVASEFGDRPQVANALFETGVVLRAMGEIEDSKRCLIQSIRISLELGVRATLAKALLELAWIEVELSNHDRGRRLASILAGSDLGTLQEGFDALVAALPGGLGKRGRKKSPEKAAREIVDEMDYLQLLL